MDEQLKVVLKNLEDLKLEIENGTLKSIFMVAITEAEEDPNQTKNIYWFTGCSPNLSNLNGAVTFAQYKLNRMIDEQCDRLAIE